MVSRPNRTALITGVSVGGSGYAAAAALAQAGWTTYAGSRRPETLESLGQQGIRVLRLDVTDEVSIQAAVSDIEAQHGAVDVLVNNAAYGEMGAVEEVPIARIRRQFETNVFGLVRMCQAVLPGMRRKGWGRIVNVSSMGGEFTTPFAGFYHASKYAVESLSDALRMEVQPFGIEVVVVQPGGINTPLAHQTVEAIPADPQSAYALQLHAFRQVSEGMRAMFDQLTVSPEQVTQVIVDAVEAVHPLTRYKVTLQDMQAVNQQRDTADRERDKTLRQQLGLTV
jgi:NAD(P)-dependent dehydrogenase (short-subunit alcohol dehydrogenase family)